MPHVVNVMDECLDAMAGNATTGRLIDLKTAYHVVDEYYFGIVAPPSNPEIDPNDVHELMEEIQAFLCTGGTFDGAAEQVLDYTTRCNAYLV